MGTDIERSVFVEHNNCSSEATKYFFRIHLLSKLFIYVKNYGALNWLENNLPAAPFGTF
jgi:hypothetical protein